MGLPGLSLSWACSEDHTDQVLFICANFQVGEKCQDHHRLPLVGLPTTNQSGGGKVRQERSGIRQKVSLARSAHLMGERSSTGRLEEVYPEFPVAISRPSSGCKICRETLDICNVQI